jgi:hypothetical protein
MQENQELQLYSGSLDLNTLPALLTKSRAITAQVKQATEPVIAEIKAKNLQTEALQGLDANGSRGLKMVTNP